MTPRDKLLAAKRQAHALGQVWAESICRGEYRARQWSDVDPTKVDAIARRRLAKLAAAAVVGELVPEFVRGAAEWWERRPARYRAP